MIATGNHQYSNSLRGAPPLISKGSLLRCPQLRGGVDKSAQTWYFIDTGVLPVDGSPVDYEEVTAAVESRRLLLLIIIIFLANQGDNCDNDHTESK